MQAQGRAPRAASSRSRSTPGRKWIACHAERLSGADIGGRIVDEQEVLGPRADALEQDLVDAGLRLDGADVAGDHRDVERVEEVVLLAGDGEFVGCEVAQRMDRPAGRFETSQERDVFVDRPAEGLDPALVEEAQFAGEFGKGLGSRLDRGGEIGRGVGMDDEIHRQRS